MTDLQVLHTIRAALTDKLAAVDACLWPGTTLFLGAVDAGCDGIAATVSIGGAYQEDLRQLLISYQCQLSAELGSVNEQITQLTTPTEVHHAHLYQ